MTAEHAEDHYVSLTNGARIRYTQMGSGKPLVLLHTLRTQLEYFERLAPLLKDRFTVYALDLPGMGASTLPKGAVPDETFIRESVMQFIGQLDLKGVTILGESIGGVLALTVAASMPGRVAHVCSLNPYDYGEKFGGGIRRSKFGFIIGVFAVFRQYTVEPKFPLKLVLSGAFGDPAHMPDSFVSTMDKTGKQPGYRKNEYLVYKHWHSWVDGKRLYPKVTAPVTLVYGEKDWSRPADRQATHKLAPHARLESLPATGHFSAYEAPEAIARLVS